MLFRPLPWALLLAVLASGYSASAWALDDSDKEAVRLLSNDAAADFREEKYEAARDKFTRAFALAKVPKLAAWVARSHERLGELVSAYEYYRQAVRLVRNDLWIGDTQERAQEEAEKELKAILSRLARVTIAIEGAPVDDVEVRIDGVVVPSELLSIERLVDPGKREITATCGVNASIREVTTFAEGEARVVVLRFDASLKLSSVQSNTVVVAAAKTKSENPEKPLPTAKPLARVAPGNTQTTWGWVGVGVGATGLMTGILSGLVVVGQYGDLEKDCPDGTCDEKYRGRVESYRSMRTLSLAGFIVGGVGAAVGVTLLLASPKSVDSGASVGLWLSPSTVGLDGKF